MGEFSPFHWLITLAVFFAGILSVPWLAYRHGKKIGDATGYMRGYKEGQQSGKQ
jgi:hypothetical protein